MAAPARAYVGIVWKVALLAAFLYAAHEAGNWLVERLGTQLTPSTEPAFHRMLMLTMVLYVLFLMLPFVPGAEIGLGLLMMFGAKIAPLVYAGTVLALTLAFLLGRLVPDRIIVRAFEALHLRRAASLLREMERLGANERPAFLLGRAPARFVPFLLRFRLLGLALAFNLPGNAVVGGGGGIALAAGASRLVTFPAFVLTVALAVAPVPLVVYLAGG